MPCMGPTINENDVKQAVADIMELLRSKYDIQLNNPLFPFLIDKRSQVVAKLHEAVREVFWQEAAECF
jgi:hypothetical protein